MQFVTPVCNLAAGCQKEFTQKVATLQPASAIFGFWLVGLGKFIKAIAGRPRLRHRARRQAWGRKLRSLLKQIHATKSGVIKQRFFFKKYFKAALFYNNIT